MSVSVQDSLTDQTLVLQAEGLTPSMDASVTITLVDGARRRWVGESLHPVPATGVLDLAAETGRLLTELELRPGHKPSMSAKAGTVEVTVKQGGKIVGTATARRRSVAPGVERIALNEAGLVGTFFAPVGRRRGPGMLVLGGSEGGKSEHVAALFASHGIPALALAYFGVPGLPPRLELIDIEYLMQGVGWLGAEMRVDPARLGVHGGSKGAEAALILASYDSRIRAVAAFAPSAVVYQGLGRGRSPRSSWRIGDEPMPFVPLRFRDLAVPLTRSIVAHRLHLDGRVPRRGAVRLHETYQGALSRSRDTDAAHIPVERISGPVLLIAGRDDGVWPSSEHARLLAERLKRANFPHEVAHLDYAGAGHDLGPPPYRPTMLVSRTGGWALDLGGTAAGTASARIAAWRETLAFFGRAFGLSDDITSSQGQGS